MFPSLLSLALVGLIAVNASPLTRSTGKATLNFATWINGTGTLNIVENDRARAQALKNASHPGKRGISFGVANSVSAYTAQVGIGSPATYYTLVIDTGSSNTWIGATNKSYIKTSTSNDTGNSVSVSYGSANFSGEVYTDTVTLGPGLVIANQSIGVAKFASGFNPGMDGILGVGPVGLTSGTVAGNNTQTVLTISDSLRSQGIISEEVLGIYFVPASESNSGGTLTFGGFDDSVITSSVKYTSLTTAFPSSRYWGINQSISYGGITILPKAAGVVDTGTTLILLSSDAFEKYKYATGGIVDPATGLLAISSYQYDKLETLSMHVEGTPYDLSPNAQIWPRSLNTAIGGNSASIYLVVGDIGSKSEPGYDFVNGYAFLERFYSVYDTTNSCVGFATTAYTDATTN